MPVLVSQLVTDSGLPLRSLWSASESTNAISWASTTELADPRQFLRGGELVMTTGLFNREPAQQWGFVESIASVPVAALGYGTGFIHDEVPAAIIEAAIACGVPLFEVPVDTPFVAISHWIADRQYAERYELIHRATVAQAQLTQALLSDLGLASLVRQLSSLLGTSVQVTDRRGLVLETSSSTTTWPSLAELLGEIDGASASPIEVGGIVVAYLCLREAVGSTPLVPFAVGMIGLEIARTQAIQNGRRELLGQVVYDIVHEHVTIDEARRRLARYGYENDLRYRLVVGRVTTSIQRIQRMSWDNRVLTHRSGVDHQTGDEVMSALVDDLAVVLVPETQDHMVVAESLLAALEDLDPHASVGIGGLRRGVRGIRISYFEAGAALHAGSGISDFAAGTITGLLLGQSDAPVRDMAVSLLRPLVSYDASKHGELLTTLRTFLDQRCSPGATADILAVHRNGLKYRLDLIMELTGRDLSRFDHCVELWLALRALDQPE